MPRNGEAVETHFEKHSTDPSPRGMRRSEKKGDGRSEIKQRSLGCENEIKGHWSG